MATRSETDHRLVDALPTGLLVGGEWRPARAGTFAVADPSTGADLCQVAEASAEDALDALAAAQAAQPGWAATPPRDRSEILRSAYEAIVARSEDFARLMTLEMGKPLADSRAEVSYGADFFRWFAEEAVRVSGRWSVAPNGGSRLLTMAQPVGPVLMITPWNFPLAMGTRKIGPALAAGCTMIIKPAELTPLTMIMLADLLTEVGLPPGVLNLVTTSDPAAVTEPLLADPRLRKITFTGSTEVGRALAAQAAPRLLRVSLELGGNAPFIVFDDADLGAAVDGAMLAKMRNIGQACTAANRFLVQAGIAEAFTDRLTERMAELQLGAGQEDGVEVGPLVSETERDKVAAMVDDAVERGAVVRCGGTVPQRDGWFYPATVLTDVPADARVHIEEIFGPVAVVSTFDTEAEVLTRANDTEFGLVAYLYTSGLDRSLRMAEGLAYGMVGVNEGVVSNAAAPFGGVKQSGYGREGGAEGIEEYLSVKYVGIASPQPDEGQR